MQEKLVIRRNGEKVKFDRKRIVSAISKANTSVPFEEKASLDLMKDIALSIEKLDKDIYHIEEIQDEVERLLLENGKISLGKNYILYREERIKERALNTIDKPVVELLEKANKELEEENSNKDSNKTSTERDLVAGLVSSDLTDRMFLPEKIVEAHKSGEIHFHDKDYFMHKGMFNCCLINIEDMLKNKTVMNGKMIETPKSFQVACTVTTQIIASVASSQYGGQSVDVAHLSPYLKYSEEKHYDNMLKVLKDEDAAKKAADFMLQEELSAGIQTVQYQINTLN